MRTNTTLVDQTKGDILKFISTHGIDTRLPKEEEFVKQLGVSRVVVREALSGLRAAGIVETKRKKGTVAVVPEVFGALKSVVDSGLLDKDTLRDLYQMRLMLEIGMADFVYMYKTDEQLDKLDGIVKEEVELNKKMLEADSEKMRSDIANRLTDVDFRFHTTLFEMTGNKSLMDFQYILRHLFTLYFPKTNTDYHAQTLVTHTSLFNILRTSTPDAFRMGMRLHLKTQFDNMEAILSGQKH